MKIVDEFGSTVLREVFTAANKNIDVSTWHKGVYFVQIYNKNGEVNMAKLIKTD